MRYRLKRTTTEKSRGEGGTPRRAVSAKKKDYNINSEEEGIKKAFAELASNLIKCDYLKENCPEVLRDEIKAPRYKIIYRFNPSNKQRSEA